MPAVKKKIRRVTGVEAVALELWSLLSIFFLFCNTGLTKVVVLSPFIHSAAQQVCRHDFLSPLTLSAITCGHPGNPTFGMTQGTQFNLNDVVRFICNTGYVLQGAVKSTCQANGQWSNALPRCKSECQINAQYLISAIPRIHVEIDTRNKCAGCHLLPDPVASVTFIISLKAKETKLVN